MKRNILKENMRRFGTKNIQEQQALQEDFVVTPPTTTTTLNVTNDADGYLYLSGKKGKKKYELSKGMFSVNVIKLVKRGDKYYVTLGAGWTEKTAALNPDKIKYIESKYLAGSRQFDVSTPEGTVTFNLQ